MSDKDDALNRTPLICRQKGDTKRVEMTVFDRLKTDIVHPANRSFLEVEFNFTTIKMKFMRSTFKVLFFLKRDKQKKDGSVPVYCRITIDGKEIESCGDTCVFVQNGLEPEVDFSLDEVNSNGGNGITDNAALARVLNRYKNDFGKSRVVVIKSQLGQPIAAFSGCSTPRACRTCGGCGITWPTSTWRPKGWNASGKYWGSIYRSPVRP